MGAWRMYVRMRGRRHADQIDRTPPRLFRRCFVHHTRTHTPAPPSPWRRISLTAHGDVKVVCAHTALGRTPPGQRRGRGKGLLAEHGTGASPKPHAGAKREGGVGARTVGSARVGTRRKADTSRSAAAVGAVGAVGAAVTGSFHGLRWFRAHQTNATPKITPKNKVSKEIEKRNRGRKTSEASETSETSETSVLGSERHAKSQRRERNPTRSSPCPLRDGTAAGMRCEHDGATGIGQAGEWPHAKPSQPWRAAVGCK